MKEIIEKLKKEILDYCWMTCYPNADWQEFEKNWLKVNDNEAFINGLTEKIIPFLTESYKQGLEDAIEIVNKNIQVQSNYEKEEDEEKIKVIYTYSRFEIETVKQQLQQKIEEIK